ncbi:MAG: hypothetical protein Q7V58_03035 [Actinomycetota bacterium]|nr:hypothetical protein [Actinomycetota bacterium]
MNRRIWSLVAAVGLTATLIPAAGGVAQAAPAPLAPDARPRAQVFFWDWEDGVDSRKRTFRESDYGSAENLPRLIVTAEPARPSQYIKLQYKQNGKWRREDADTTDGNGEAFLALNPYCNDNTWCDGTYKYRLLVNGKYTLFTITYID